jgi:hypothetical protein
MNVDAVIGNHVVSHANVAQYRTSGGSRSKSGVFSVEDTANHKKVAPQRARYGHA